MRTRLAMLLVLSLAACGASSDDGDLQGPGGAGGKADAFDTDTDAGYTATDTDTDGGWGTTDPYWGSSTSTGDISGGASTNCGTDCGSSSTGWSGGATTDPGDTEGTTGDWDASSSGSTG